MIYAFTGKTGSGKTFSMVNEAFRFWLSGKDIYSNIPLFFDVKKVSILKRLWLKFKKIDNQNLGKIKYFSEINEIIHIKNGIILFDEAQVLFNARSWDSLPEEFQYKIQQHRKHELHLLCTTQNMGTIDIAYRRLVQYWEHCENTFQLGISPIILFGLFRRNIKDIDQLYNTIDDLKAETIKKRYFFIGKWSKCLYDTMFDIGFKRFKSYYITEYITNRKTRKKEKREICYIFLKSKKYDYEIKNWQYYKGQFR
jgi:hypothetical protein